MEEYDHIAWAPLKTAGYLHLPAFLSIEECEALRRDFARGASGASGDRNANYDVQSVSVPVAERFEPKLAWVARRVEQETGIVADCSSGSLYFSAERLQFPWHQDHESFFLFQDHAQYLNFYIPFIKPDPKQSNVCLIPFDRLLAHAPAARRLVGGGATVLHPRGAGTQVLDNENGRQFSLPVNIEALAVTPELHAGDLLLLRGDVIHRTQDGDTGRVAVSFRRQNAAHVLDKERLLQGSATKQRMMRNNPRPYDIACTYLRQSGLARVTVGELLAQLQLQTCADHALTR